MTALSTWRIDGERAHLQLGELEAAVDIARPHLGLHDVRLAGEPIADAQLLAPRFSDSHDSEPVADSFVRGRDLVVTYAPTHARPVRLQVYWRASSDAAARGAVAAIDVQVSVQTNLLDAWPALEMRSRVPSREVFRLSHGAAEAALVAVADDERSRATPADEPGCWLCRLPAGGAIYAEMVHPDDVERQTVTAGGTRSSDIRHRIFAQRLEKGVILRARARGAFIHVELDPSAEKPGWGEKEIEAVAGAYARFLTAPLPLTT